MGRTGSCSAMTASTRSRPPHLAKSITSDWNVRRRRAAQSRRGVAA
jgi:hypothetical protein